MGESGFDEGAVGSGGGGAHPERTMGMRNAQGRAALDDIIGNVVKTAPNRHGGIDYYGGSRGGGARYDGSGNFMGFLEP